MKKQPITANLQETAPIADAKKFLRENWHEGAICPTCTQIVKRYKTPLGSTMAYVLILMVRYFEAHPDQEYVHVTNYLNGLDLPGAIRNTGDSVKLQHWGLIENKVEDRTDGSKRNGWWKVTEKGRQFAKGEITVPAYAFLFNSKCYGHSEEEVDVRGALRKRFNYEELWNS